MERSSSKIKKFLIFQEMDLSSSNIKKFLIFQETERSYIFSEKSFSYISRNEISSLKLQDCRMELSELEK